MKILAQLSKFGSIGMILAIASIAIYHVAFNIYSLPLYTTYISVFLVSVFFSYHFNAKYTFEAKKSRKDLINYYGVYLMGLAIGLLILKFLKSFTVWSDFVVTIASILPRVLFTFLLSKIFIFKK